MVKKEKSWKTYVRFFTCKGVLFTSPALAHFGRSFPHFGHFDPQNKKSPISELFFAVV